MEQKLPLVSLKKLWECKSQQNNEVEQVYEQISLEIDHACRDIGFFVLKDHNIEEQLFNKIHELSLKFFDLPQQQKEKISMDKGGKAWRGWFPLGKQLTSGKADGKEGIYFGTQCKNNDQRPLHGINLFPDQKIPEFRPTILQYLQKLTKLGHILMRCIAKALKMPINYFEQSITKDPTILFRIFLYPPNPSYQYGVGQHTDYGLLTLLCIDDCGGLEVKSPTGKWIQAPCPQTGKYLMIINIGDMLQKMSQGRYKSTPHRVRNNYTKKRISFPLFFDPSWQAKVDKLPLEKLSQEDRWDGENLAAWQGQYGSYLTKKVSKCFPELFKQAVKLQN